MLRPWRPGSTSSGSSVSVHGRAGRNPRFAGSRADTEDASRAARQTQAQNNQEPLHVFTPHRRETVAVSDYLKSTIFLVWLKSFVSIL